MANSTKTAAGSRKRRAPPAKRRAATQRPAKRESRRQSLRNRLEGAAASRFSRALLALVAYTESFVFLIPPDILLIPMAIANPRKWIRFAGIATAASVAGALTGYAIGALAYQSVGEPLLEYFGFAEHFEGFASDVSQYGAWAVIIAGITPFPFKVATILSGAAGLNLAIFLVCCVVARGFRFAVVAWFVQKAGPAAAAMIEKRLGWLAATCTVAAICIILAVALLP